MHVPPRHRPALQVLGISAIERGVAATPDDQYLFVAGHRRLHRLGDGPPWSSDWERTIAAIAPASLGHAVWALHPRADGEGPTVARYDRGLQCRQRMSLPVLDPEARLDDLAVSATCIAVTFACPTSQPDTWVHQLALHADGRWANTGLPWAGPAATTVRFDHPRRAIVVRHIEDTRRYTHGLVALPGRVTTR